MADEPQTYEEAVDIILGEMRAVMIERQKTYGSNNVRQMGSLGVLNRAVNDKVTRLRRYYEREDLRAQCNKVGMPQVAIDQHLPSIQADFPTDKLEDGHIDAANFLGPIGLMLRRGWWGLPMEDERQGV